MSTTKPWGSLPVSRIVTIMKSSSEVENIGKESSLMMTKLAELFIKNVAKEAYTLASSRNEGKKIDYKHLAEIVNTNEKYEFLKDIMPKKITVLEYKKILEKEAQKDDDYLSSSNDDNNSNDSDSESE